MGSLEDLERRIARVEDVTAIERVMALYAKACDTGYDHELFASLFTADGVWESNASASSAAAPSSRASCATATGASSAGSTTR